MKDYIPYGRQNISEADISAVVEVLKSDFVTQGPMVSAFEDALSKKTDSRYCIAVNSATSALHIACQALGVMRGDLVWTTPISFVATSNAALYLGAEVDFVDIDPETFNMSTSGLEEKLKCAQLEKKLPKVVIPVHIAGQSCEMQKIFELSQTYGFKIIEDASHAIGGKYRNQPIGSCQYSDVTVFSFHPVKIITTGEGGALTTNSEQLFKKLISLRSHGITRDEDQMISSPHGPWYYEQLDLGYNYRITDFQAALGTSQLKKLEDSINKRQEIASFYKSKLAALPLTFQQNIQDAYSSYHLFIIRNKSPKISHRDLFLFLREKNIGVNLHYMPIYLQPYYQKLGFKPGHCPNAEKYYSEAISIPMYPELTFEQMNRIVNALLEAIT